jgi:DNA mismatch repair protein MutL
VTLEPYVTLVRAATISRRDTVPIRVLGPDVAARIAAGEVVERPASVVKELVENALDAGASRVAVDITGGGLETMRVTDDGCGIEARELPTAFERHATSKLSDDADLMKVQTLGFRGEALPSIVAVAEVEVASRPPGAEAGAWLRLVPDSPPESGSRGAPVGTSVLVRKIFGRLPARRKFLRAPGSEANAIAAVVTHYALAYPEVRFSLMSDGRQVFATPGSGDLRDAAAAVYGLDLAAELLPVTPGEGPVLVEGLCGPPHVSRSNRTYISLFANRRWIQNRRLSFAVEEAYRGMLMVGRHPVAMLNVTLPPEEVDVNVHPTKTEVRFREETAVFGAVQRAVREALLTRSPVAAGVSPAARPGLVLAPEPWTPPLWERGIRGEPAETRPAAAVETAEAPPTPAQALPVLRVIGQFGNIYIIAEGPEGMYLIDQHAAHERVLYEHFCEARMRRSPDAQGLLDPVTVELPPRLRSLAEGQAEALSEHGFAMEAFGEGAVIVRALPAPLARGDVRENVVRFLDLVANEGEGDRRDRVAMSLACHGAIRAGKQLSPEEMRELVLQLEAVQSPHTCPHGRPTIVHMSGDALARGFGRR